MKKIIIVAITLTFLVGIFYWFQWRPSEIKKECASKRKEALTALSGENLSWATVKLAFDFADTQYVACLHAEGL